MPTFTYEYTPLEEGLGAGGSPDTLWKLGETFVAPSVP